MASPGSRNDESWALVDELKQCLFNKKRDWAGVVKIFEKDSRAHEMKITTSGDTALHVAISSSQENIVQELVKRIFNHINNNNNDNGVSVNVSELAKEALSVKNEKGDTPLHLAAVTGKLKICKHIIEWDADAGKSLLREVNKMGETPLFKAVHYGRKEVFLYLHSAGKFDGDILNYGCRYDGQTILQNAIIRENFDLAFEIIRLYNVRLVDYGDINNNASPLRALAKKPACFKSGRNLQGREKFIYQHCTFVEKLKFESSKDPNQEGGKDKTIPDPPKNNPTSFVSNIGLLLKNLIIRAGQYVKNECANVDIENRGSRDQTAQESQSILPDLIKDFSKLVRRKAIPFILGYGHRSLEKIHEEKKKHVWADLILDELLKNAKMGKVGNSDDDGDGDGDGDDDDDDDDYYYYYDDDDYYYDDDYEYYYYYERDDTASDKADKTRDKAEKDATILLAAKFGIKEMVEKILKQFPKAINEKDKDNKNVVLLAVENRHLEVYKFLIKKFKREHAVFLKVDDKGNTVLHYAAMYDEKHIKPWPVPGAALQMQWEIKWHEFMEKTMPLHLYLRTNGKGNTPRELFSKTHRDLVKAGGEWVMSTATFCSVVATLVATVAYTSSTTAPGGGFTTDTKAVGRENSMTLKIFAISSLIALCFSVTSLVIMFLAILTARQQEDFSNEVPRKILYGLTSLFVSISFMLVAFCAGHFLVFRDIIKYAVIPVYAVSLLPLCLFAAKQFPLCFDIYWATFWHPFREPKRKPNN